MAKRKRLALTSAQDSQSEVSLGGGLGTRKGHDVQTHTKATETLSESRGERRKRKSDRRLQRHGGSEAEAGRTEALNLKEEKAFAELSMTSSQYENFLRKHSINVVDPLPSQQQLKAFFAFEQLPDDLLFAKHTLKDFPSPTPIQATSWPLALSGRDIVGIAETGSGKTLAFGLPCVAYCVKSNAQTKSVNVGAVIVSPTRELAHQIYDQISLLSASTGLNTVCVYGGASKETQRIALKSANIVVGTPGRLNDFIDEGAADLSHVRYLVLDEADRMLDKGFEEEVKKIIRSTPSQNRQTLMFTATWPQTVRSLASTFMQNPVEIFVGDSPSGDLRANTQICQTVEVLDSSTKDRRLHHILKEHQSGARLNYRILVFCLYKKEAARVERFLRSKGIDAVGIHGDMAQAQRTASLVAFKNGDNEVMVATDVSARGLDIPEVKLVINVTFPLTVEDYVHRIGRHVRDCCYSLSWNTRSNANGAIGQAELERLEKPLPSSLNRTKLCPASKLYEY